MKRTLTVAIFIALLAVSASAQKTKPWTEWNEKEALKILTDSPWAQTQKDLSETSTAGPAITTAAENRSTANMVMTDAQKNASESGETLGRKSAALSVNYRVSFLSARPVRAAFIRMIELQRPELAKEKVAELRTFVDRDFADYVVVTLLIDGTDKKRLAPAMQEIASADANVLKTTSYLERKDGKRVSLTDYRAPIQDGMGAKFIFPRTLDGAPFIDAGSGEVRVYIELSKVVKVNRRFKVADMMYDGKLEY